MKIVIITKIKFKKDQEKIENVLITYGFKKITENVQTGKLNNEELDFFKEELKNNTSDEDTIILIPVCNGCYNDIKQYGKKINLEEEKYVIL